MGDNQEDIINGLSSQIMMHLRACENESTNPQHGSDKMDATIKYHREMAISLREAREVLENAFTRVMPDEF